MPEFLLYLIHVLFFLSQEDTGPAISNLWILLPAAMQHSVTKRDIIIIGALNMDMLFASNRPLGIGESINALSFTKLYGGKGANTAIAAYRLSHKRPETSTKEVSDSNTDVIQCEANLTAAIDIRVALHGAVGGDEYGEQLRGYLAAVGVDVSKVDMLPMSPSGICCVLVNSITGESSNIAYQGANMNWQPSEALMGNLRSGKKPDLVILHLDTSIEAVTKVLRTTAQHGVDTLLNPSPTADLDPQIYQNLTHLILNESEAARLTRKDLNRFTTEDAWKGAGRYFVDQGVEHVVITLGAKGAYYMTASESGLVIPARTVASVDTTGAGDTFVGMYAVEYVKTKRLGTWNVATAVERACKAAALSVGGLGAQDSIPWSDFSDSQ
ncbi:hypothetical protein TWF281_002132 [Arthrobotrys megalospora]